MIKNPFKLTVFAKSFISKPDRLLLLVTGLAATAFCIYTIYLAPRPYYITEMDIEQDYYYNAQLLYHSQPVTGIHHPGTAIYYLGYFILHLSGSHTGTTQRFFNIAYLIIAFATTISLFAFIKLLLKDTPLGISILILASVLVWPPFLTYLNFFGSESFIVAIGLTTIAYFWLTLEKPAITPQRRIFITGLGLGACLAVKMSFLPVALAACVAWSSHVFLSLLPCQREEKHTNTYCLLKGVRVILPLIGGIAISFLVFTAPIFSRLLNLFALTLNRSDAFPAKRIWLAGSFKTIAELSEACFPFVLLILIASVTFLTLFAVQIYRRLTKVKDDRRSDNGTHSAATEDKFDYLSGGIFITLMLLSFLYTANAAVSITPGAELGVRLRNMSPTALFIPFMILYCYRLARGNIALKRNEFRVAHVLFAMAGFLILWSGIRSHFNIRHRIIGQHAARIAVTKEGLDSMLQPNSRIAFWTVASQDFLGEISFHYWGNYRYGRDYFDKRLIEQYPSYALFRLRSIGRSFEETVNSQKQKDSSKSRYGKVGDLYWQLKDLIVARVPPSYVNNSGIVTGEQYGVQVSTIAFPESQIYELSSMTEAQLLALINTTFGLTSVQRKSIGDIHWVIISVPTGRGAINVGMHSPPNSKRAEAIVSASN